ncbi:hypothetical protein PoB_001381200 [Plakobranchus ocellatus]|uniref:RRM domain-containing protein n=1 Tax=Plakobranchus ocellatus TaxID=259542 RepID=A0AAV3YYL9_9GAST|nr:hypothetical protein PoB_001381200 [Plakobranchus ocellatus]
MYVFLMPDVKNYDTSESKLRREFEVYGPVKKICLINDRNTGKPRGYAFIEYEHERDMHYVTLAAVWAGPGPPPTPPSLHSTTPMLSSLHC